MDHAKRNRRRPAHARTSLLRDQRGTASIEAALMLPVMAICWAGLMLRFDQIERYLDAAAFARRDAWAFSVSGCEDDPPNKNAELKVECIGDDASADWMQVLSKIPVVNFFVQSISGYKLTATGVRQYTDPPLFGGGAKQVKYPYVLMCNEKSRDGTTVLEAVLCQTVKGLGLGFAVGDCPMEPKHADGC